MKKLMMIILLSIVLSAALLADVYIKTVTKVDPINAMGQSIPARETISEQWISDEFYYVNTGEGISYLYDLKKNIMYFIAHRTKSYLELTPPVDFSSLLPAEMAPMAQALQQMTVSVQPTGETKIINNIKCQGYRLAMTMMMYPVEMTIWASEDLPVNLKSFLEKVWPEVMKMELQASGQAAAEISKIKGLWMAYEIKAQMMGADMTSRAEVVELSKKPAPRGIYALPEGYRKKDRLEMADLQGF